MKKQPVTARRTEILETTCQVVIERGFAATRISDVAKRLEVSTSLIHYHFESKEQLLAEAFAHYARKDLAVLEAELRRAPNTLAQLDCYLQDSVPEGSDDMEWMLWIDAWGEALRNPAMRSISQELDRQALEVLEHIIDTGARTGEMRCDRPRDAAERIASLIDGLAVQFAAHDHVISRERLLHHLRTAAAIEVGATVDVIAAGVTGGRPSAALPVTETGAGRPVQELEAELERVLHRYADAVTRGHRADWIALWAPDATWDHGSTSPAVGIEAILAVWDSAMAGLEWVVHTTPTMVFEVDAVEGTATARVTVHERFKRQGDTHGSLWGIYHDRLRRSTAGWHFVERRLNILEVD